MTKILPLSALAPDAMRAPLTPVPLAPVLSAASFARGGGAGLPSVLDAGPARLVTSGRVAIAMALREMNLQPGDAMLVPAWHTQSQVAPLLWAGVRPVFYDVGADGQVDPAELARRWTPAVRALTVTHYFGFHQDMVALRAWSDAAGVALLEDCAHCWFGAVAGRPAGAWGDYAIASSMKFYPTYEGGCLVSARHALRAGTGAGAGLGFEAKAALGALERAFGHGRLRPLERLLAAPLAFKRVLWTRAKARQAGPAPALAPDSSDSSVRFEPAWIDRRSALFSRAVLRLAGARRVVQRRRANYARLAEAIAGLPGLRALHPRLPEGVCPWVFPLLADDADALFAALRARGVPLVRFAEARDPGASAEAFPNSARLVRQVLGVPVHQELRADEVAWLCAALREAGCA